MNDLASKFRISHLKCNIHYLLIVALLLSLCYSSWNALVYSQRQYGIQLSTELAARGEEIRRFHREDTGILIAHGGGVGAFLYTNSAEAVEDSLRKGFAFIELDLLKTADNHLLAAHDWNHFHQLTGTSGTPVNLIETLEFKIKGNQTPLSGRMIHTLMQHNPEMILVTDKISDFELLLREIPHPDRMIVEVFSPLDYTRALKAGVLYPAFCVTHNIALQQAVEHKYPIITISEELFQQHLDTMRKLHQQKVCIMVYGTEGTGCKQFIREHGGRTASMIYTSSVSPADLY